jgi:glycosyltransferase involved in cell wall biosynthesis
MAAVDEFAGDGRRPVDALSATGLGVSRESAGAAPRRPARPLDFDVVIATRNRPEALALSIPLILGQSRRPQRLILIDSSDDHAPVAEAVARATAGWDGTVIVEHSEPGLTRQRNRGLALVEADVVILPDDDSLFHPGTSEAIMRAYELDVEGRIAGVCAADAQRPPPGVLAEASYQMTSGHKVRSRLAGYANRIGRRFNALNPTMYIGSILKARFDRPGWRPDWIDAENCVLVEYMTGYRMSFRTAAISASGFDETLTAYAVNEDRDASFGAMRHGPLVGARNARIYHHKFPSGRGDPYTLGMMQLLNRSYITLKHVHDAGLTPAEAQETRRLVRQYCRFRVLTCLPSLHRRSGREHLRGTLAALDGVRAMLHARREDLPRIYTEAQARIAAGREGHHAPPDGPGGGAAAASGESPETARARTHRSGSNSRLYTGAD